MYAVVNPCSPTPIIASKPRGEQDHATSRTTFVYNLSQNETHEQQQRAVQAMVQVSQGAKGDGQRSGKVDGYHIRR